MSIERQFQRHKTNHEIRASILFHEAKQRLHQMFGVAMGFCHCGSEMESHTVWDNHMPHEVFLDKSSVFDPLEEQ